MTAPTNATVPIRIAAVDDHSMFLQGVRRALGYASDMTIMAEGATAEDACKIAVEAAPDVMLLDIGIPGDGIMAAHMIASSAPRVKIIIVTGSSDDDQVMAALNAGAKGYLLKGVGAEELQAAIRTVHAGQPYLTSELASRLVVQCVGMRDLSKLTDREQRIIRYATAGLTNKEIALRLDLPVRTIRKYMSAIMRKSGKRNRLKLVLAFEQLKRKTAMM